MGTSTAVAAAGCVRSTGVAMPFAVTVVNDADRATLAIAGPAPSKDIGLSACRRRSEARSQSRRRWAVRPDRRRPTRGG